MRNKIVTQPELNLNPPSLKITQEFYAKYDRISHLLDENPAILDLVHGDLASLAEMMEGAPGDSGLPRPTSFSTPHLTVRGS